MKTEIKTCILSTAYVIALMALACTATTGKAVADQPGDALTSKVTYADLDLESAQGAKTLYRRLQFAAQQVCAPLENSDLSSRGEWRNCVNNALNLAVSKVDKPLLSTLQAQSVSRGAKG